MGFFGEAKHKVEEVVGRIEETLGGAFGNSAMQASGHAHAEHGEALVEEDEAHERHHDNTGRDAVTPGAGTAAAENDEALRQRREQEQRMTEVDRQIREAKRAQDAVADSGEQLRHAGSTGAPTEPGA